MALAAAKEEKAAAAKEVKAMRARVKTAMTEAQSAEEAWLKAEEETEAWTAEVAWAAKAPAMAAEEAGKETARQVRLGYEATMKAAEETRLRAVEAKERTELALAAVWAEEEWLKAAMQAEASAAEAKASASAAEQAWLKAEGEDEARAVEERMAERISEERWLTHQEASVRQGIVNVWAVKVAEYAREAAEAEDGRRRLLAKARDARLNAGEATKAAKEARLKADSRAAEATKAAEEARLKAESRAAQARKASEEARLKAESRAAEAASLLKAEDGAKMQFSGGAGMASSECKRRRNTNPPAQAEARASMVEEEKAEGRAAKRRHGGRNEGGDGIGRAVEQANAEGQD